MKAMQRLGMVVSEQHGKDEDVANGDAERREAASGSLPREESPGLPEVDPGVKKWELLWDEYKHRHDLVWRVVLQITTAAVVLSVVPYLAPKPVVLHLGLWVLSAPALAFLSVSFSMMVVYNELVLLGKIRTAHRRLQDDLFKIGHGKPSESDRTEFREVLSTRFGFFTCAYLLILAGLSVANGAICTMYWVPCVLDSTQCLPPG
jgi:hypothetical protein